ncbi:cupredoxin domain-containing protein [Candidatus Korobacter versatilis]|nr:cupredoxin domain-containing protein [Candidatus Koribacter versatilis]
MTLLVIMAPVLFLAATNTINANSVQQIDINAHRFSYEPKEITIKKGHPVTLVFHSQDVSHGFVSEEFRVKTDIPKRGVSKVTFTPQNAGDFVGKCAHFCGAGHGEMQLTIHVVE